MESNRHPLQRRPQVRPILPATRVLIERSARHLKRVYWNYFKNSEVRAELQCPCCGHHPLAGEFWNCHCGARIDPFAYADPRTSTPPYCTACGETDCVYECPFCEVLVPWTLWNPVYFSLKGRRPDFATDGPPIVDASPPSAESIEQLRAARARAVHLTLKPLTGVTPAHRIERAWADRLKKRDGHE